MKHVHHLAVVAFAAAFFVAGILLAQTSAPKPEEDPDAPQATSQRSKNPTSKPAPVSRAALDAMIDKAGKEPPTWWDSVKLTYPQTLDLTWAPPTPGVQWNPQNNIGVYYLRVINPNPAKHQEGCKLMHHIYTLNKDKPDVAQRATLMLGRIYAVYLQDYARGAFWFRKGAKNAELNAQNNADLAFCYYKLGAKDAALTQIANSSQLTSRAVRVVGSMGEVEAALDYAEDLATFFPEDAYIAAGDVCRYNGQSSEALKWYQKIMDMKATGRMAGRVKRYQDRASADITAVKLLDKLDVKQMADGTYTGESTGFRGPVKVDVTVKDGKLANVKVGANKEDWPLNVFVVVPAQIIDKQSVTGIDMISGATFTSEAVINAAAKAIGGASKK